MMTYRYGKHVPRPENMQVSLKVVEGQGQEVTTFNVHRCTFQHFPSSDELLRS